MSFANKYFNRYPSHPQFIVGKPADDLSLIITIPAINEHKLLDTLNSLLDCSETKGSVEVIIGINSSEKSSEEILLQNQRCLIEAKDWINKNSADKRRFYVIHAPNLKAKHAGAGWARKIVMDEAVRRCDMLDNQEIPIAGFDADSFCAENYLFELEQYFIRNEKIDACSINFEHRLDETDVDDIARKTIVKYELHLRYLLQAIRFTSFPLAFHNVGSSFAVRAKTYIKQGGMNRRTAGEDFYFLNKIIESNTFADLTTTTVYPSARPSDRVPFGTGATITKHLKEKSCYYETYCFESFEILKGFFALIPQFYDVSFQDVFCKVESEGMKAFLEANNFSDNLEEVKKNSSNKDRFLARFFRWFNMFRIIKYLNFMHDGFLVKDSVESESSKLLERYKMHAGGDAKSLMMQYREIDKNNIFPNKELWT